MALVNCIGVVVSDDSYIKRFCSGQGFFNAQFLKPNKLSPKFDEINNLLIRWHLNVIGISETWFKSYVPNKAENITGYNLIRNNRCGPWGGGVVFYISDNLKVKMVSSFSDPTSC